jgi:hypothetical protein
MLVKEERVNALDLLLVGGNLTLHPPIRIEYI